MLIAAHPNILNRFALTLFDLIKTSPRASGGVGGGSGGVGPGVRSGVLGGGGR